jgi:hypothetical protein
MNSVTCVTIRAVHAGGEYNAGTRLLTWPFFRILNTCVSLYLGCFMVEHQFKVDDSTSESGYFLVKLHPYNERKIIKKGRVSNEASGAEKPD